MFRSAHRSQDIFRGGGQLRVVFPVPITSAGISRTTRRVKGARIQIEEFWNRNELSLKLLEDLKTAPKLSFYL